MKHLVKNRKTKRSKKLRHKTRKNMRIRKGGFISNMMMPKSNSTVSSPTSNSSSSISYIPSSYTANYNKYMQQAKTINPQLQGAIDSHSKDLSNIYGTANNTMNRLGKATSSLGNAAQAYSSGKPFTATGHAVSALGHTGLAAYNASMLTGQATRAGISGTNLAIQGLNTARMASKKYPQQFVKQYSQI